ncbi:uncharacterized protein A1O9_08977 [Exophiala aquamarina CBS 119918]|uniref:Nucleoside phosphorylase domain-containing protein n=1 Tax=Exophiala aquamarina CBS 119918 TaxID=1182545 RepID=A0A072P7T0_9EURO|nr:uncharacterized protein A1O9_08977 [Exophiala aquamarina CBS 119918]KEF55323.1 hypothetical protein A1O9_08977 [Exophiala aquamarina CBS 119918]
MRKTSKSRQDAPVRGHDNGIYRIVVAGGGGVGKSCFVIQAVLDHYVDEYDPTIEDSYRRVVIIDERPAQLEILDTAGQEEYASMREQWMRECEGLILMYSITSRPSLEGYLNEETGALTNGVRVFHSQILRVKDRDRFPIVMVGHKCDLAHSERQVSMNEGRQLAEELGCTFHEASAKSRINVDNVIYDLVRQIRRERTTAVTQPISDKLLVPEPFHRRSRSTGTILDKFSLVASLYRRFQGVKVDIRQEYKGNVAHQQALNSVLIQACRLADARGVKKCLANGADPKAQPGADGNALHASAALGHGKIVSILLDHHASPNAKGPRGVTALQLSSAEGHSKVVKLLLGGGAKVDESSPSHGTSLIAATSRGRCKVAEILIKHGANVSTRGGQYGNALHTAVFIGSLEIATLLLDNGASVHERGAGGSTALQTACSAKHAAIVHLLLDRGADPNASGGKLGCPLEVASETSRSDIYDILIAFGADPSRCAPHRDTNKMTIEREITQVMVDPQCPSPLDPVPTTPPVANRESDVAVHTGTSINYVAERSPHITVTSPRLPSAKPRLSHAQYTIGIVCPMSIELVSVEAMLDQSHHDLPTINRGQNAYSLGSVGQHNVVITVMPEIGNNHAAIVGTQMKNDFPRLEFALLVGIGGGIPGDADVRLGDVVVSKPERSFGGVIQYDMGKYVSSGAFERTGHLRKPPPILSAHVERLRARQMLVGNEINEHLSKILFKYPNMTEAQLVPQNPRENPKPQVHYGTIGSANALIKDSVMRNQLKRDSSMICVVEMEAAGLMESIPCLVIRGISDYADSHKNKIWQSYAAAVAAAYMKELLLMIPPMDAG